jgi:hypothetical protein
MTGEIHETGDDRILVCLAAPAGGSEAAAESPTYGDSY